MEFLFMHFLTDFMGNKLSRSSTHSDAWKQQCVESWNRFPKQFIINKWHTVIPHLAKTIWTMMGSGFDFEQAVKDFYEFFAVSFGDAARAAEGEKEEVGKLISMFQPAEETPVGMNANELAAEIRKFIHTPEFSELLSELRCRG